MLKVYVSLLCPGKTHKSTLNEEVVNMTNSYNFLQTKTDMML